MMTRRAIACVAAFAAAVSVGALGYAVLWAFDVSELMRPVAQQPQPPREAKQEPIRPAPRRKPLVVVAPRVPGEDMRVVASPAGHGTPPGDALAVAPLSQDDELSLLVAIAPPPTPPTPGEDGPSVAASARVSVPSPAADRPMRGDAETVSALVPQNEAAVPPIDAPAQADPEPTGTVGPPAFTFGKPRPIQRPRDDVLAPPPGVMIIRGVPPVPDHSPGIVRPGPLIIHVPQGVRR
jgi:hypothetical protein